jgi:large subunit ribosomal protein L17
MRHGNKVNHLGRTTSHRKAMLSNMATSLILHKRITTTLAKARSLRKYVEPLLTKAKTDTMHSRRVVFSYLRSKEAMKELFGEIAAKIADRPGGYTRILKIGNRPGDNAEMALIELVDYNEFIQGESRRRRRTRRGKGKTSPGTKAGAESAETENVVLEEVAPLSPAAEEIAESTEAAAEESAAPEAPSDEAGNEQKA